MTARRLRFLYAVDPYQFPVTTFFAGMLQWALLASSAGGEEEAEVNCDKNRMNENCRARRNFDESDKQLNYAYRELMGKLKSFNENCVSATIRALGSNHATTNAGQFSACKVAPDRCSTGLS